MSLNMHRYDDSNALAQALAAQVRDDLTHAIEARGHAVLALSGGRTPERFLDVLSTQALDWSRVTVTLVDERWVPPHDERSNARMVRQHLLQHAASAARFVPLYATEPTPEAGLPAVSARIDLLSLPIDVVTLGMGTDGHTASFFPGSDRLPEALDPRGTQKVLPMRAKGADEPRITLTLALLAQARSLYLQIEGDEKRAVLEKAAGDDGSRYPVGAMLSAAPGLQVYWAP